ncbi:cysteine hydrolase [Thalassobaculum sp.]|uniref:cysteine hydrolase family protein n=1 Tax=Thalassobaculum sp. TaxID=2022740 RepID=UPI0032EDA186
MSLGVSDPQRTALVLVDLQNDFIHPDGAYGRGGAKVAEIGALPARLTPLIDAARRAGSPVMSTHFTLVHGPDGEPYISEHLLKIRPFLRAGDFVAGGWGHDLLDELQPSTFKIEKVAFSAFYMSRMEWVLRRAGIETLVFAGIVTNGGVASTVRDAHVRDFHAIVLADGCAAFTPEIHDTAIAALRPVAEIWTVEQATAAFRAAGS